MSSMRACGGACAVDLRILPSLRLIISRGRNHQPAGRRLFFRRDLAIFRREFSCLTSVRQYSHSRDSIVAHPCDSILTIVRRLSHSRATTFSQPCDVFLTAVRRLNSQREILSSQRILSLLTSQTIHRQGHLIRLQRTCH